MDGHSTRCDKDALKELISHNVSVIIIPAHSSHVLQPLDCYPFSEFKRKLSKGKLFEKKDTIPIKREKTLKRAILAWKYASMEDSIEAGFTKSGLVPFDPQKILRPEAACLVRSMKKKNANLEDPAKGKRISISNRVISSINDITQLFLEEDNQDPNEIH